MNDSTLKSTIRSFHRCGRAGEELRRWALRRTPLVAKMVTDKDEISKCYSQVPTQPT